MQVEIKTTVGTITVELDAVNAPVTVENFLAYTDSGFYAGTVFHRVIDGFMIQGGGLGADMRQKRGNAPIKNEWRNGLKNLRGTIAMARLGGDPDSATSQFFINVKDNGFLDRPQSDGAAYCVFGKVVGGMEVVDAIRVVKTTNKAGHQDVPVEPIVIEKVSRVTQA